MLHSTERILTTHAGSLPRPRELCEMFARLSRHEPIDGANLNASIETATREVIRKQLDAGIDIGNNGEQARESFFTYVQHRMSGFGGRSERPAISDVVAYPSYRERLAAMFSPDLPSIFCMRPKRSVRCAT
jgi:5-methyltetrahydropteroyltriglutamate--homocysteine methyltransferase